MNENEREKMLKRVQICDFVLADTALFLDTNPDDKEALDHYKKYMAIRVDTVKDYVSRFGPIEHGDHDGSDHWKWVDGPWPWENREV